MATTALDINVQTSGGRQGQIANIPMHNRTLFLSSVAVGLLLLLLVSSLTIYSKPQPVVINETAVPRCQS